MIKPVLLNMGIAKARISLRVRARLIHVCAICRIDPECTNRMEPEGLMLKSIKFLIRVLPFNNSGFSYIQYSSYILIRIF